MKYLYYRSDEKIDMLSRQLTGYKLKSKTVESNLGASISAETPGVKIKPKFSTGSKTSNTYSFGDNVIEDIENALYSANKVDNAGLREYVHTRARMNYSDKVDSDFVAWWGEYYPNKNTLCVILMLGSKHHVIGDYSSKKYSYSTPLALHKIFEEDGLSSANCDSDSFAEYVSFFTDEDEEMTLACEFLSVVHRVEVFDKSSPKWSKYSKNALSPLDNLEQICFIHASPIYVARDSATRVVSINGKSKVVVSQYEYENLKYLKKGLVQKTMDKIADFLFKRGDTVGYINPDFIEDVLDTLLNAGLINEANTFNEDVYSKLINAEYGSLYNVINLCEDEKENEASEILDYVFGLADSYIVVE